MSEVTTVKSDQFTRMLSALGTRYFLDKDFIMTMRASELNGPEEFDNAMAWAVWHGYLEGGLQQLKDYADQLQQLKKTKEWNEVPKPQQERIEEFLSKLKGYDFSKPVDDKENIKSIRNDLTDYNENLVDGITMYDVHTAILNGRFARERGTLKAILEISKNAIQREYDIEIAGRESRDDRSFIEKHLLRKKS